MQHPSSFRTLTPLTTHNFSKCHHLEKSMIAENDLMPLCNSQDLIINSPLLLLHISLKISNETLRWRKTKKPFFNWVLTLEFPACSWIFFQFTRPCSNLMFAWSHYFICLETKQFLFLLYPKDTKSPSLLFSHMVISTYIIKRLVSLVPHTQYAESSFLDFSS